MALHHEAAYLIRVAVAIGLAGMLVCGSAAGQGPPGRASLSGRVLDAQSGHPLAGAVVTLLRRTDSIAEESAGDGDIVMMQTDQHGAYRFEGLSVDRYSLLARRLGYRPASVEIDLRGTAPLRVSLEMTVNPVLLEPERITAAPSQTFPRRTETIGTEARVGLEAVRRDAFVPSDVRIVTEDDMLEGVTLAEADVLRATHMFPGVTTRDDYTAELWTRGAPWSHTRVFYDGLPLFNPLHAAGAFGGIHPDAIGSAEFYPGVRPANQGEGAAGALDVSSRRATTSDVSGLAELSIASVRASAASRTADGNIGWMVAARRSYVDLVSDVIDHFRADASVHVPYAFFDLAGRVDAAFGPNYRLELSGLWERDDLRGSIPNVLNANQGHWGNRLLQAAFTSLAGDALVEYTVGTSQYDGRIEFGNPAAVGNPDIPNHAPTDNRITYWTTGADVQPAWSNLDAILGYRIVHQEHAYAGPGPSAHASEVQADTLRFSGALTQLAVWASAKRSFGRWLDVDAGARAEIGESVRNVPDLAIAPRVAGRVKFPDGATVLSVGWGRSFQYTQTVAPAGPGIGPELHLTDVWLLAGDTIPAIRSDIATAGVERTLETGGWTASINLYRRFATGLAVPDPRSGERSVGDRPVFVEATNLAVGVETSVRKLTGPWTGSVSYSLGRSTIRAAGARYPGPADRRHVVDATVLLQPDGPFRLGLAATVATGAPFTRVVGTTLGCDSVPGLCYAGPLVAEPANAERGPTFTGVNAMAEWRHDFQGWQFAVSLQLRNVLNRANAVTYAGSIAGCAEPPSATIRYVRTGVCDEFVSGLPLLPLVSLRARF